MGLFQRTQAELLPGLKTRSRIVFAGHAHFPSRLPGLGFLARTTLSTDISERIQSGALGISQEHGLSAPLRTAV
jgi:hypothetical protein